MKKALSAFQVVNRSRWQQAWCMRDTIILNSLPDLRRYIKISTM